MTAHWETTQPVIGAHPTPPTVHDFGGFPSELYRLTYPAPGAPELAARIRTLLLPRFPGATLDAARGLDHGAWMPLWAMYPHALTPVVQLSVQPEHDARHHYALGRALMPLRDEGVLLLGSGNMTHNLYAALGRAQNTPPDAVEAFCRWAEDALTTRHDEASLNWQREAPHAGWNHPTPEHWLPLYFALGASTGPGRRLHHSIDFKVLAMDAYSFS